MEKQTEEILERIYQKSVANDENIITILQDIQNELGYVQEEAVEWFAKKTRIPVARFYGVTTFYSQFHLTPRGKNIVTICSGTVCHVKGAEKITTRIRQDLRLGETTQTTKDMNFTLENVNCVGACSIAPVVIVNDRVYGKQTAEKMLKNLKPYKD